MTTHHRISIVLLVCALGAPSKAADRNEYRIDAKQSRFIAETQTGGLSALFAHDHRIEVADFAGTVAFTPGSLSAATFELTAKAASLRLVRSDGKDTGERQAIEGALREDVLEATKYPTISFKSKSVTSERRGDGTYDVRITGDLLLHGVRRKVVIPARVALQGDTLRAIGVFEIRQTDFKITPFSFVSGTVVIKDTVILSFDIVAARS